MFKCLLQNFAMNKFQKQTDTNEIDDLIESELLVNIFMFED